MRYHYPTGPRPHATDAPNGFMLTGETPSTPERRAVLLALAQADGQVWTSSQSGSGWTDHMAEMMYGKLADAIEGLLAKAWDEGAGKAQKYRSDLDLSPLNPYRTEER